MKKCIFVFFFLFNFCFAQEMEVSHSIYHSFIENKGQWDEKVLFQTKFQGGNLWVQQNKFVFHLQDFSDMQNAHANPKAKEETVRKRQTVVHLNFLGSNEVQKIQKIQPSNSYYNFFLGNVSTKWASDVHGFSEVIMEELYNGIDLKLIEQEDELKYEFHVKPNADPSKIVLEFAGQEKIKIDKKGDLVISTELGAIIEHKPYCYQLINNRKVEVKSSFKLFENTIGFELGRYDPSIELIIDPVLVFATYSGSITDNFGMTATYAHDGKAYSGGTIFGNSYPTPDNGAYDISSNFTVANNSSGAGYGVTDVFISKYSADGTNMIWTTFFGGGNNVQGTETVHSLIADTANNLYLLGATSSIDFPIQNGYQPTHGGGVAGLKFYWNGVYHLQHGTDIFVSKLSANGHNLLGSTYMGGSGNDGINYKLFPPIYNSFDAYDSLTTNYGDNFRGEIMLDKNNNCIVASSTRSVDFPVLNAFQSANAGQQDGVVFQLSSDLSTLQWSSYFGGTKNDACYSVKVDSSSNIVFAGGTCSSDLPKTAGKWQPTYNGGKTDGFVGKIKANGSVLSSATYVGTTNYDQVFFVEIDREDNVFLLGHSIGGLFPVINADYVNPNSSQFICKLDSSLTTVSNSTVFGNGSQGTNISPAAFMVDICGNMYVSGWGANILYPFPLSGMPVTPDAFQPTSPNGFDFYLFVLNRTFNSLIYATYMGGSQAQEHVDGGTSRFDKNGVVYQSVCGGCGAHSDFPTTPNAWSNTNDSDYGGKCNNILFKFDFQLLPKAEFKSDSTMICEDSEVNFTNHSSDSDTYLWDFGNGDTSTIVFNPSVIYSEAGSYDVYLYVKDSICLLTDTAKLVLLVLPRMQLQIPSEIDDCEQHEELLVANTFGTANTFIWSSSPNFSDTLNLTVSDSTFLSAEVNDTYYIYVNDGGLCPTSDSINVHYTSLDYALTGSPPICDTDTTTVKVEDSNPSLSFSYLWSPSSIILTDPTANEIEVQPLSTQYVYLTSTVSDGCVFEDSLLLQISPPINLLLPPNIDECNEHEELVIANSFGTATTFIWSSSLAFSDTLNNNISDSTFLAPAVNGTYYIYTNNIGGCSKIDSVTIHYTHLDYQLSGATAFCFGDTVTLAVNDFNPALTFTYLWSPLSVILTDPTLAEIEVSPLTSQYLYLATSTSDGCTFEDSVLVQVTSTINLQVPSDIDECEQHEQLLIPNSSGAATIFIWSTTLAFSDTLNTSVADSTFLAPEQNATYYIYANNVGDCAQIDSVTIHYTSLDLQLSSPSTICYNDITTVEVEDLNPALSFNYLWSPQSVILTDPTAIQIDVRPLTSQYINLVSTVSNGCTIMDSILVNVTPQISLELIPDIEECEPHEQLLVANSFGEATSFIWSSSPDFVDTLNDAVTDSTFLAPEKNTTYYLYINNGGDCPRIDTMKIHYTRLDMSVSGSGPICYNDTLSVKAEDFNPLLQFSYLWSPTAVILTNPTFPEIKVHPLITQYIYLLSTVSDGCVFEDSILVEVSKIDQKAVSASVADDVVPVGANVILTGMPAGFTYEWTPAKGVLNPAAQITSAVVNETTLYTLSVSDGICTKQAKVLVKTFPFICDDPSTFIPNAFSPNGDGNNDVLFVRGKMIKEMTFRVFDRWGELVFESFDRTTGWDGTYKGKKMDPDVYDYYLKVTCIDNQENIVKGNVTLLR